MQTNLNEGYEFESYFIQLFDLFNYWSQLYILNIRGFYKTDEIIELILNAFSWHKRQEDTGIRT